MFFMDAVPPQALWEIPLVAPLRASAASANPAFLARGDIKGMDVSPPIDNWESPAFGMTPARVAAMKDAGYDTHRIWISLTEFLDPPVSMAATLDKWVGYADKSVKAGFRVFIAWDSTGDERTAVVNDPAAKARFVTALHALCNRLSTVYSSDQVALEIMNEPPDEHYVPGYYREASPAFFKACRAEAPQMTIIFQPENGWSNELKKFDLKDFDENTMFSFHPYGPGEFTHQSIGTQPHLFSLPMPITRYSGGQKQMVADVTARINADNSLSADKKVTEIKRYSDFINYFLWYRDGSQWEDWSTLQDWVNKTGINPKRLVAGEFGVVSEFNWTGAPGLPDVYSRANYLRKIKNQVEDNRYGGWVVHQAMGDFNMFEQTSVRDHGEKLIPELTEALFGNGPLPEGPPVTPPDRLDNGRTKPAQ